MKRVQFAWVTDIPTPYRVFMFERMAALMPSLGVDPFVHFMTLREWRRPWALDPSTFHFPHRVHKGIHPIVRGRTLHVNPSLATHLWRNPADVVMVGGWASPSHVLAGLVAQKRSLAILGIESNSDSVGVRTQWADVARSAVVRQFDGFLVASGRSKALLEHLAPAVKAMPFIEFPNLVDGDRIAREVSKRREAVERARIRHAYPFLDPGQTWICPARLSPEKGLEGLIEAAKTLAQVRILIAGDGPLRAKLESLIAATNVDIRLLGQLDESSLLDIYSQADAFVLPSLRDPNPLSPIEAAAAGLPLLLSDKAGNVDDLIVGEGNGFRLPVGTPQLSDTLARMAQLPRSARVAMGIQSRRIYDSAFDPDEWVGRLAHSVVSLATTRHLTPARVGGALS